MENKDEERNEERSSATKTAINICKICVGAGILALPYAFVSGGIISSSVGVYVFAGWNYVTADWLLQCKAVLGIDPGQRQGASTFATIARRAMGPWGEVAVDALIASVFFGVMASYLIAVGQLLAQTKLLGTDTTVLIWGTAFVMTAFCCIKNLGGLAWTSAASIVVILIGLASIVHYGATLPDGAAAVAVASATEDSGSSSEASASASASAVSWGVTDLAGMATFTGIITFSYGIQLMAMPLQEAMKEPKKIWLALGAGLFTAATVYWAVGVAVVMAFQHTGVDLHQNVMQNLPPGTPLTMFVGISVAVCVTFSYPLSLFPLADMVWHFFQALSSLRGNYQNLASTIQDVNQSQGPAGVCRVILLLCLIALSAACASFVPFLGLFVSLLGNFSITLLGFVIPAICYLRLCGFKLSQTQKLFTVFLLIVGLINCIFCTTSTIKSIIKEVDDLKNT